MGIYLDSTGLYVDGNKKVTFPLKPVDMNDLSLKLLRIDSTLKVESSVINSGDSVALITSSVDIANGANITINDVVLELQFNMVVDEVCMVYLDGSAIIKINLENDKYYSKSLIDSGDALLNGITAKKSDINQILNDVTSTIDIVEGAFHSVVPFIDGNDIYTANGVPGYGPHTTGRGAYNYMSVYGIKEMSKVLIPETTKLVKTGGYTSSVAYALYDNGNLYTWGYNKYGQCGLGHTNIVPIPKLAATGVVDVYTHASNNVYENSMNRLIIKHADGYIYGTGYNGYGQLGTGDNKNKYVFTKLVSFGNDIKDVYNFGAKYGCLFVVTNNDDILVCGYNSYGQLGAGDTSHKQSPVNVTSNWINGNYSIVSIHGGYGYNNSGYGYTVVNLYDAANQVNVIRTCGHNGYGQLGDGTTSTKHSPISVDINAKIKQVHTSGSGVGSVRVLTVDGIMYAWGYNGQGQLGTGDFSNKTTPTLTSVDVEYIYIDGISTHSAGYRVPIFIKKSDGYVYASGHNSHGECGVGTTANVKTFTKVQQLKDIDKMSIVCCNSDCITVVSKDISGNIYAHGYNGTYLIGNRNSNSLFPIEIKL